MQIDANTMQLEVYFYSCTWNVKLTIARIRAKLSNINLYQNTHRNRNKIIRSNSL